jgi:hypothetical protein
MVLLTFRIVVVSFLTFHRLQNTRYVIQAPYALKAIRYVLRPVWTYARSAECRSTLIAQAVPSMLMLHKLPKRLKMKVYCIILCYR